MEIGDLIDQLQSVNQPVRISEFAGKTVAVDGRAWLPYTHKTKDAQPKESNADTLFDLFKSQIKALGSNNVTPVVVFDGDGLPCAATPTKEERNRCNKIAQKYITWLTENRVHHLIAPCEADAQLAHLLKTGAFSAVITAHPHAGLLFAAGCSSLLLTDYTTSLRKVSLGGKTADHKCAANWSPEKLQALFFVLCCRHYYLPSLPGLTLSAAQHLVDSGTSWESRLRKWPNLDPKKFSTYEKAFRSLQVARTHQPKKESLSFTRAPEESDQENAKESLAADKPSEKPVKKATDSTATPRPRLSTGRSFGPLTSNRMHSGSLGNRRSVHEKDDTKDQDQKHTKSSTGRSDPLVFTSDNKENIPPWMQRVDENASPNTPRPPRSPDAVGLMATRTKPVSTPAADHVATSKNPLKQDLQHSLKRKVPVDNRSNEDQQKTRRNSVKRAGLADSSNRLSSTQ